ncbi:MAG: sodium ion-translocating decarboxylase subunit beta [Eubacteriales bacterium]
MAQAYASIGIIGGADGPTAVFVSGSLWDWLLPLLLLAALAAAAVLLIRYFRKRGK